MGVGMPSPTSPRLQPGMTLGRYVVLYAVGAGGMGEVVAAYDPELDRKVAIKVLRGAEHRRLGREGRARLLREARAIARLCDRNVLPVYHVGEFDGELFLAMKLVESGAARGVSIGHFAANRPWRDTLAALVAAGRGLAAAHRAGLVHRDVKPSNVLVDADGEVYVCDFGVARATESEAAEPPVAESDEHLVEDLLAPPTKPGVAVGTPIYMAPEQHVEGTADARSDQFSFCIVAWELLFGAYPFDAGAPDGLLVAKRAAPTRAGATRGVPHRIEQALVRGLAYLPEDRHASMEALLTELQGGRRRGPLVLAGATTMAASIAIATGLPRTEPCDADERLATAWDDERRGALVESFASAAADETPARVLATLDGWTDRWRDAYAQTCADRAQLGEAVYDARMACLGRRVVELGALVDVLVRTDGEIDATSAVHGWTAAGACEGVGVGAPTATTDPEIARLIARARALLLAGRYSDAVAAADDAVATATWRNDVPAQIEASIVQGDALIRGGDAALGAASYEHAVQSATSSGADEPAARAATRLMRYFAISHDVDEAMLWSRHAEGALLRLGAPPRLQADWLEALGIARGNGSDYPGALAAFDEALALQRELGNEDSLEAAALHNGRAVSLDWLARRVEAKDAFLRSLEISTRLLGERHPTVALRLMNVGHVELGLRMRDEARAHLARALEISEQTLEARHPQVGVAARGLAEAELESGRAAAAEPLALRGLELLADAYGPQDARTARSHEVVARVAIAKGDGVLAVEHADAALAIFDAAYGARHLDTAFAHDVLADALMLEGRTREAREHYLSAVAVIDTMLGPTHHDLAHVLEGLARAELEAGDAEAAAVAATRALAIVEREGVVHVELAQLLALAAHAERAAGRGGDAATRFERARAIMVAQVDAVDGGVARWVDALARGTSNAVVPIPAVEH